MTPQTPVPTGTDDSHYDLKLPLQQALEDCVRYQCFADDSRQSGDDELANWFTELAESDAEIAEKAKTLLVARLVGSTG